MSALLLGAAGAFALALLFFVLLVPARLRRGILVAVSVMILFLATSENVPENVRDVAQAAAAAGFIGSMFGRSATRPRPAVFVLLLFFFGISFVVTAISFPEADNLAIRISVVGLLGALAVMRFTAFDLRVLLHGLVALALLEFVFGLVELLVTHEPALWGYKIYADGSVFDNPNKLLGQSLVRVQGTTGHPIPYGVVMVLGVVALVAQWRVYAPVFRYLALAACLTGLLLSGSRGVFIALALALVYLLLTSRSTHRATRILSVALIGALALVLFWSDLVEVASVFFDSGSYTNRSGALSSVPLLLDRPALESFFGSGIGSQLTLYARGLLPQNGFLVVDNQLVTTLGTAGLVGLTLLVAVIVVGFRSAPRAAKAMILIFAAMLFSFDFLVWSSMATLFVMVLAMPRAAGEVVVDPVDPAGSAAPPETIPTSAPAVAPSANRSPLASSRA
jgi:hypothetical protein